MSVIAKNEFPSFVLYQSIKDSENDWTLVSSLNSLTLSCSIQSAIVSLECTSQRMTIY